MSLRYFSTHDAAAPRRARPLLLASLVLFAIALLLIALPLLSAGSGAGAWWRNVEPLSGLLLAIGAGVLARIGGSTPAEVKPQLADVTGAVGWARSIEQLRHRYC